MHAPHLYRQKRILRSLHSKVAAVAVPNSGLSSTQDCHQFMIVILSEAKDLCISPPPPQLARSLHSAVRDPRLPRMKTLPSVFFALFLTATALAQPARQTQPSNTTENLRGISAVSLEIAWASGTHGTYLRTTDAGLTWIAAQVPDAAALDFRGVVAFSADEAFLMSAGPGDQSRIYHTADAGKHWQLQFTNTNPKGFFDSMVFWDRTHGVVLGDPIADESGKFKFEILRTDDGQTWRAIPPSQLPSALEGEGAFAASNTCIAILPDSNVWFAT